MHKQWEQTQLPQLERKSYKLWRQSQNPNQIQTWQGDAEHWRGQVAKLVHAVALIHVGNARLPVRAIKKSSRSIQQMYVNLQEVVFKLKVSELLQEPTRPSRKRPAPARCVATCLHRTFWVCKLHASHAHHFSNLVCVTCKQFAHQCIRILFMILYLTEC